MLQNNIISEELLYSLIGSFVISMAALVGLIFIIIPAKWAERIIPLSMALAIGFLLGNAIFHLIPEASINLDYFSLTCWTGSGIILFLMVDIIASRLQKVAGNNTPNIKGVGILNLIGDGIHNFIDGIIIASSFMISTELGIATTIAILLHELPQEFSDTGTLIFSGFNPSQVIKLNFLAALTSIGGVIMFFIVKGNFLLNPVFLLAITAGGFIYISIANLIPAVFKFENSAERNLLYIGLSCLGVFFIIILHGFGHDHSTHKTLPTDGNRAIPMGLKYYKTTQ